MQLLFFLTTIDDTVVDNGLSNFSSIRVIIYLDVEVWYEVRMYFSLFSLFCSQQNILLELGQQND